jgi:putative flippase GtrA
VRYPSISRQLKWFLLIGGASYALNVAVLFVCVEWIGLHYVLAMMASFLVVVPTAHFLNRRITFKSDASYLRELGKYNVVIIGQFAAGLLLMAILIELGRLPYLWANALSAVLLTALSFLSQKLWTFEERRSGDG